MELPDNGFAPHGTRIARILIVGAPSAGKTTIAVPLAVLMCPDRERIRCVDPSEPPKLSTLLGVYADHPSTTDRNAQEQYFRKLLTDCQKAYPNGECLMVMDESDMFFTQGGRGYGCQALKEIAHIGRGCFLAQIYISRSPLDLSRSQRGLFNVVFIGRNTEPRAAEWWEDYTGIPNFGRALQDIPEHTFIVYATDRVPHILGTAWVENGQIQTADWEPPTPEETEPSETSDESEEADGSDTAESAERPYPTDDGADTASTTSSRADETTTDSTPPSTE